MLMKRSQIKNVISCFLALIISPECLGQSSQYASIKDCFSYGFSTNGQYIVCDKGGRVECFRNDGERLKSCWTVVSNQKIDSIAIPDRGAAYVVFENGRVEKLDLRTGKTLAEHRLQNFPEDKELDFEFGAKFEYCDQTGETVVFKHASLSNSTFYFLDSKNLAVRSTRNFNGSCHFTKLDKRQFVYSQNHIWELSDNDSVNKIFDVPFDVTFGVYKASSNDHLLLVSNQWVKVLDLRSKQTSNVILGKLLFLDRATVVFSQASKWIIYSSTTHTEVNELSDCSVLGYSKGEFVVSSRTGIESYRVSTNERTLIHEFSGSRGTRFDFRSFPKLSCDLVIKQIEVDSDSSTFDLLFFTRKNH